MTRNDDMGGSGRARALDARVRRSTSLTGELQRARFGAGQRGGGGWLAGLPGPVRAVYEAGPTGFGL